jgi:PKHD-type hydroxylase
MIVSIPGVLREEELKAVRVALESARFVDGKVSAGGPAREQKHVLQLDRADNAQRQFGELIAKALLRHPLVQAAAYPKSIRHPSINRYEVGMFYGPHLDAPIMHGTPSTRVDVSVTVFLSSPSDYSGGELVIGTDANAARIKGHAGDAVLYSAGSIHHVTEVQQGARVVAVTWIESLIRNAEQRALLLELGRSIAQLERDGASAQALLSLRATHQNLVRMWADSPSVAG